MNKAKKVLYITNIEVPYKVRFFNKLSKCCNLTVLYERESSNNRNKVWAESEIIEYDKEYLGGIKVGNEFSFSFRIFRYLFGKYDEIVVSCFNSPVQLLAILVMRLFHRSYILSLDGEIFIKDISLKNILKRCLLPGAKKYLTAGEHSAELLRKVIKEKDIIPYYFSSLDDEEIKNHRERSKNTDRGQCVLVVGQYYDYKGMDIALQSAKMDATIRYKFIGMGKRTDMFVHEQHINEVANVEVVPFMQKKDLEKEYLEAAVLVLPSRQECWGLVINEAASFGTPIVASDGSGAAIEFLTGDYTKYLVEAGNAYDLYSKIKSLVFNDNKMYSQFLIEKGEKYSIESMVEAHCRALELK